MDEGNACAKAQGQDQACLVCSRGPVWLQHQGEKTQEADPAGLN